MYTTVPGNILTSEKKSLHIIEIKRGDKPVSAELDGLGDDVSDVGSLMKMTLLLGWTAWAVRGIS